jgi:DNA-binding response OmpR family regulator
MATTIEILLVDDEVRFLETLGERLSMRGFDVITATNGMDALERARGHSLDLALVDLKMPGMDGEELLRKLKREHPLMEVVILTGHGSAESRERCEDAGSYEYLQKPCETSELVKVLRAAFEKRMLRRLQICREELDRLMDASVGEASFRAILRLKDLEEELLRRKADSQD